MGWQKEPYLFRWRRWLLLECQFHSFCCWLGLLNDALFSVCLWQYNKKMVTLFTLHETGGSCRKRESKQQEKLLAHSNKKQFGNAKGAQDASQDLLIYFYCPFFTFKIQKPNPPAANFVNYFLKEPCYVQRLASRIAKYNLHYYFTSFRNPSWNTLKQATEKNKFITWNRSNNTAAFY